MMLKLDSSYFRLFRILGYYTKQIGISPTDGMWHEIETKLEQLDFLERKIHALNNKCGESFKNREIDQGILLAFVEYGDVEYKELELGLLTESFYHLAWALRELLRSVPGLKKIEFEGIRDVRNHLLLHLDKPENQNYGYAFGYGGALGPVIKPEKKHSYQDAGFYENVDEMKECIFQISNKLDAETRKIALKLP